MKKILLIGGGGHCKSVLDSMIERNEYDDIAIIDKNQYIGKNVMGISIIGSDEDLVRLFENGYKYAFITLGSIGDSSHRIRVFEIISKIGYEIPVIVDKSANLSKYSRLEQGVFVGKNSVINAGSVIKKGAIINSGAIVEHDCEIGEFSHISPGVVLGGGVFVGERCHIGINSSIKQEIYIGNDSIVGMGSVVLNNIKSKSTVYGNPCREVK